MKTYYCVHARGTQYHEIKAPNLTATQIVANFKFGSIRYPLSKENTLSQRGIHLFDDPVMRKKLFPEAKWSGLSEATDVVWDYVFHQE